MRTASQGTSTRRVSVCEETMSRMHRLATLKLFLLMSGSFTAACESRREDSSRGQTTAETAVISPSASAAPRASATAANSTEVASPPSDSAHTGTFKGKYSAKKTTPSLAPDVVVKSWKSDDGKRGAGEGRITLTIESNGRATGIVEGPLGPATLEGSVEGKRVRAELVPDRDDADAFSGLFDGTLEGSGIVGTLRAADGSASVVREAQAKLDR